MNDKYRMAFNLRSVYNSVTDRKTISSMLVSTGFIGLLSLAFSITCFVLYAGGGTNDVTIPVTWTTFTRTDFDVRRAFNLNATLWAALLLLVNALVFLFDLAVTAGYGSGVADRFNMIRWLGDLIYTPGLVTLTVALWGLSDLTTLLFTFTAVHLVILTGVYSELWNRPGESIGMWPVYISAWGGLLAYLPFLITLLGSSGYMNSSAPPALAVTAFILVLLAFAVQIFYQRSYVSVLLKPSTSNLIDGVTSVWVMYESRVILFTMLPKLIAALLIGVAYTMNNGWVSDHAAAPNCLVALFPTDDIQWSTLARDCPDFFNSLNQTIGSGGFNFSSGLSLFRK